MTDATVLASTSWFVVRTNLPGWRHREDASLSLALLADGRVERTLCYTSHGHPVIQRSMDRPAGEGWFLGRGSSLTRRFAKARWRVLAQTGEWGVLVVEPGPLAPGGVLVYSATRHLSVEALEAAERLIGAARVTEGVRGGMHAVRHRPARQGTRRTAPVAA